MMTTLEKRTKDYLFPMMIGFFFFQTLILLPAQESPAEESPEEAEALPEVPAVKLTPIFPESEEGLIYIEGEDAVSTNFSTTAVYNYGASAYRSLQLIQQNAPYGGQSYYAEYAFYVEEAGDYFFWYGGTPPGPKEDVYPSYASPFRYILDDQEPVGVYREDLAVVEAYTPSYYWMEVDKIFLTPGVHKLRVEVAEKRRFDGQYYFFMDAFFLLREDRMEEELTRVPPLFPRNRLDRSIDNPFQSIPHYETAISEDPGNKSSYIVLSLIYSLLGDYINAIRHLNSAVNLDPEDPYPLLLMAKNRIWNGEISAGLTLYRQLLILAPDNPSYWAEAGKVAAWTGKYRESLEFFTQGLERFPGDLNLQVNLGLTYLWMSRIPEAEAAFLDARESTREDHRRAMDLGEIHSVNGYPQYAVEIYNQEIARSPAYLETYLSLEKAYRDTGEREKAREVIRRIYDTFEESEAFSSYMNVYEEKLRMKEHILEGYRLALEENPDNINLRRELAQTYFWNGLREEAVDESLRILINKMYLVFRRFDAKAEALLSLRDRLAYRTSAFQAVLTSYSQAAAELEKGAAAYLKAEAALAKKPDDPALLERLDQQSVLFSEAYAEALSWTDRLAREEGLLEDLEASWKALAAEEQREEETFRQLLGDLGWSWDRNFSRLELRQVQRDEPFLAGYILGRLALFENRRDEASRYLDSAVFAGDPPARYGLYQTWLWQGNREQQERMWGEEADVLTLYRQHLFDLEAALPEESAAASGYFLPTGEDAESLWAAMEARSGTFREDRESLEALDKEMSAALDRKLNRQFYSFEQDTYLLRYELGNYYLDMEENVKASRQYDRVLAMDPWNISANYKLGVVSQRSGNWHRAMTQYKKVYYQNPRYENAAYYYNQLARAHADVIHITGQSVTDTSRISYQGTADYRSSLNNRLGWGVSYRLEADRLYRAFGDQDPSAFRLHTLSLHAPVTFPGWNLTLTPVGGAQWNNAFVGEDFYFNPAEPVSLEENYTATTVKPLAGWDADWTYDFLTAGLDYRYELEEDSLFAGRRLTRRHRIDLQGTTYFPFEFNPLFGPVTTRTFGSLQILQSDGTSGINRIGQVVQEVSAGYTVSRKPQVRLTANALINYEDGKDTDVTDYYVPKGVWEAKGGLRGTLNFHNAAYTESVEISLWGSGGGYWTDQEGSASPATKLEGQFSLYYVKNAMMLYLLIGGNGTYEDGLGGSAQFWEVSATMGCRVNVPSLLAP